MGFVVKTLCSLEWVSKGNREVKKDKKKRIIRERERFLRRGEKCIRGVVLLEQGDQLGNHRCGHVGKYMRGTSFVQSPGFDTGNDSFITHRFHFLDHTKLVWQ